MREAGADAVAGMVLEESKAELLKIAERMKLCVKDLDKWRVEDFTTVAGLLTKCGLADDALGLAGAIEDPFWRTKVLCGGVVKALHEVGLLGDAERIVTDALGLMKGMRSPYWRALAAAEVCEAMDKMGLKGEATDIANEALSSIKKLGDQHLRAEALANLVDKAGALVAKESFEVAKGIRDDPVDRLNVLSYIVEAMVKANMIVESKEACGEALEAAREARELRYDRPIDEGVFGRAPFKAMVKAMGEAGQTEAVIDVSREAAAIVDQMDEGFRPEYVVREIVCMMAGLGLADQAYDLAKQIRDRLQHMYAVGCALEAMAKSGKADRALEAAAEELDMESLEPIMKALSKTRS